jgi:predicted transcriptional regulator
MHIPTPEELKARREFLGIRQTQLATMAGISQSMVARIEAGSVDPRASTLTKIVHALNSAVPRRLSAADVMHTPVTSVGPKDSILRAVAIMEENNFSQIPVIEEGLPLGCISESAIVTVIEEQGLHRSNHFPVKNFMESGFPTVPPDMGMETVIKILQHHHAVMVIEGGHVRGVITKHDLISLITDIR